MINKFLPTELNYERFAVIAVWPQNKSEAVILMRSRYPENDPTPWSVQYRGSGYYFPTADEAFEFCKRRRFKTELPI